MTEIGMRAVKDYGSPPFIDASCRREPDFENDYPSITALCRQEKFAPLLCPNDIVVYITVKGKWLTDFDHYRLISILVVTEKKENHNQAATWYRNKNISLPSNCMVEDNPPLEFQETAGNYERRVDIQKFLNYDIEKQKQIGKRRIELWNAEYLNRSKKWGDFVVTKPIFTELYNPPILTVEDMKKIFGRVPNTRTPNKIKKEQLKELAKYANINFNYE
jgi:hypothetical protein